MGIFLDHVSRGLETYIPKQGDRSNGIATWVNRMVNRRRVQPLSQASEKSRIFLAYQAGYT